MAISSPTGPVTILGTDITTGETITVDDERRESGMYFVGVQGTGKSSLLESLIYQDICKGHGVIVIDPHGDLIEHVIAQLPEDRVSSTYLLDIEDVNHPFGVNLFAAPPQAGQVYLTVTLDRLMHVFERVFPISARMLLDKYLENIALVFLENPGYTMADIPRFLLDEKLRHALIQNLKNGYVRDFWEDFDTIPPGKRREEVAALNNRLNSFLNKPIVRNIVGQKTSTIDFRTAIQHHEILLIRLPVKKLKHIAALIGTMLVSLIHAATFSFENKPRSQRPGFSLYVDEFQNFASLDFSELFTEARKYKARQTLANQFTKQLDLEELREAVTTAYTLVAFRTTDDDSKKLAPLFSTLDLHKGQPVQIQRDNIFKRLLTHPDEKVREWAYSFLGDLEEGSKKRITQETTNSYNTYGDLVKIKHDILPAHNFGEGYVSYHPDDIKSLLKNLDQLLYETMRNGQVTADLRQTIIRALARFLHFIDYYRLAYEHHFEGKGSFAAWLADAQKQDDSEIGIKALEISLQEEAHTRFVTRFDYVLHALIAHPLTEEKETTLSNIASKLSHLENYTAVIRVGTETHLIKPPPIPANAVKGEAVWQRKRTIQVQTAKKYCRKRSEIEQELEKRLGNIPQVAQKQEQDDSIEMDEQSERPRFEDVE